MSAKTTPNSYNLTANNCLVLQTRLSLQSNNGPSTTVYMKTQLFNANNNGLMIMWCQFNVRFITSLGALEEWDT